MATRDPNDRTKAGPAASKGGRGGQTDSGGFRANGVDSDLGGFGGSRAVAGKTEGGNGPLGPLGGGSAVTEEYEPGSVPNFPDANAAAVVDMLSQAIPGVGATSAVYKGGKLLDGEDATFGPLGDMLGADTGPQAGFNRDRGKGASSFNPDDPRGETASDERAIPGRSFGAGTEALTGDSEDDGLGAGAEALFSDVTLQDRKKPRPVGKNASDDYMGFGTKMLLGA